MPRDMHPEGNYDAEILDHGFSEARTGTLQFWAQFGTQHGTITGYFPMTDAAADGSLRKIAAMGYDGTSLGELSDGTYLRGRKCVVTVKHEMYQGVTRDKVAWVNPEGWAPGPKRADNVEAGVARFNGLLQKIQSERKSGGGAQQELPI